MPGQRRPILLCATSHSQIVLSKPQLARMLPSGLQATLFTRSVCPVSVWSRRRLSTSHSLTVRSQLELARVLPSGAKASPRTRLVCPARIATQVAGWVCWISHSRIFPPGPPLASRPPSGLQATERIGLGCGSVCRGVPLRASQSRSEEHTSELQSPDHLVCRLLLEK